jgi:hypothetical protein
MASRSSLMTEKGLPCRSSLLLDVEAELSEHLDGARLSALEITGAESLARGELIGCAQDCFGRITASFPGELISRGGDKTVLGKESLRPLVGRTPLSPATRQSVSRDPRAPCIDSSRVTSASGAGLLSEL